MGLFDFIRQPKRGPERIGLGELEAWLKGRLDAEAAAVLGNAMPHVESSGKLLAELRGYVAALDGAGRQEIHPRYDKIVGTAKPAYVKSMLHALDGLGYKGSTLEDVREYDGRLSAALDAMGKASFGDGKFLPVAYPEEMARIQSCARRVLSARDGLQAALAADDCMKAYASIKEMLAEHSLLVSRRERLGLDASSHADAAEAARRNAVRLSGELESLRGGPEYARIKGLRLRFKALEEEGKAVESAVFSALSPLKSALRRYGKTAADANVEKLADALEENPVDAYLNAPDGEVEGLLEGLDKALSLGSLSLKDQDKTLLKLDAARAAFRRDYRGMLRSHAQEAAAISRELGSSKVAEAERKIIAEIRGLEEREHRERKDSAEALAKADGLGGEAGRLLADVKAKLTGLGVELSL